MDVTRKAKNSYESKNTRNYADTTEAGFTATKHLKNDLGFLFTPVVINEK